MFSGQGHKRCLSPELRESTGPAGGTRCASSALPPRRWTSADGVSSKIPWGIGAGAAILCARRAAPCPAHRCRSLDSCPRGGSASRPCSSLMSTSPSKSRGVSTGSSCAPTATPTANGQDSRLPCYRDAHEYEHAPQPLMGHDASRAPSSADGQTSPPTNDRPTRPTAPLKPSMEEWKARAPAS